MPEISENVRENTTGRLTEGFLLSFQQTLRTANSDLTLLTETQFQYAALGKQNHPYWIY